MKNLWPFLSVVDIIQRSSFRERTLFVTIEQNGMMHWLDNAGRFGHAGGLGGILFKGEVEQHFRGTRRLTPQEAQREKQEFCIDVQLAPTEFEPIQNLINNVGKPWPKGWGRLHSERLHGLLEVLYWKHVNRFVYNPFDERDA